MTGGLKFFNRKEESVLKRCLNRSEQAKNTKELEKLFGLSADTGIYKLARPSQIMNSEKLVSSVYVVYVLREDYIYPFDIGIDKNVIVSLSSGVP